MNFLARASIALLAISIFGATCGVKAAVINPPFNEKKNNQILKAKSKFNFSLNVGPQYPYPVYTPVYPVYQPPVYHPYYGPPSYPVYREYYSYSRPVYERTICSYDYWGNPYNCYVERY